MTEKVIGPIGAVVHQAVTGQKDDDEIIRPRLVPHCRDELFNLGAPAGGRRLGVLQDHRDPRIVELTAGVEQALLEGLRIRDGERQISQPGAAHPVGVEVVVDTAGEEMEPGSPRRLRPLSGGDDDLRRAAHPRAGRGRDLEEVPWLARQGEIPGEALPAWRGGAVDVLFWCNGLPGNPGGIGPDLLQHAPLRHLDLRHEAHRPAGHEFPRKGRDDPHLRRCFDESGEHLRGILRLAPRGGPEGSIEAPRVEQPRHHIGAFEPAPEPRRREEPGEEFEAAVDMPAEQGIAVGTGGVISRRREKRPFAVGGDMDRGDVLPGGESVE